MLNRISLHDFERLFADQALTQILSALGDGLAVADAQGRLVYMNPVAATLLHVNPQTLKGNPIHRCHADPKGVDSVLESFRAENPYRKELFFGNRWITVTATPVHDEAGKRVGSVMVLADITERRKMEEMLKRQNQELVDKQNRIDFQMEIAKNIQQSMLPSAESQIGDLHLCFLTRPIAAISGDFAMIRPDQNGCWFFLGDVMGKGPSAAQFVPLLYGYLNDALSIDASPATLLQNINVRLYNFINERFVMFASLLAIRYDREAKSLTFASAGHENPLLLSDAAITSLDMRGVPLGLAAGSNYVNHSLALTETTKILMVTDGVMEMLRVIHRLPTETSLLSALTHIWKPLPAAPFAWLADNLFANFAKEMATDDMSVMYLEFKEQES